MDYSQIRKTIIDNEYEQLFMKDISLTGVLCKFKKGEKNLEVSFQIGGFIKELKINSKIYCYEDFLNNI
jgi:hypothetical protein